MGLREESEYRQPTGTAARKVKQMLRRMAVTLTVKALWHVVGFSNDDLDRDVEVFSGVGFFGRPKEGVNAEVVVAKIGGSHQHPVIIATRDEETRQAFVAIANMLADETAMFNSQVRVHCTADGEVLVDDGSGAIPMATKADLDAHVSHFDGHRHDAAQAPAGSLPTSIPTLTPAGALVGAPDPAPTPAGTSIFKGK